MPAPTLTLALAKGRILEEALPLLAEAGLAPVEDALSTRKLILETGRPGLRIILVRAADVHRVPAMVRVPGHAPESIAAALDAGAAGILVPRVSTAEQARAVMASASTNAHAPTSAQQQKPPAPEKP